MVELADWIVRASIVIFTSCVLLRSVKELTRAISQETTSSIWRFNTKNWLETFVMYNDDIFVLVHHQDSASLHQYTLENARTGSILAKSTWEQSEESAKSLLGMVVTCLLPALVQVAQEERTRRKEEKNLD